MPRKKTVETKGQASMIACPVCRSKLASDGATLFEKSRYILELEETAAVVPQLEGKFNGLEALLTEKQGEIDRLNKELLRMGLLLKEANEREAEKNNVVEKGSRVKAGKSATSESEDDW